MLRQKVLASDKKALDSRPLSLVLDFAVLWNKSNIIRSSFVHQLPPGARVSQDCRDLLLRLLERNPDARITFAEFFTHPFVDLDHMPGAESLGKAVRD